MDGSEEDRHQRQNDLEKQGQWVLPTSFSEKRTLISDNGLGISSYNSISPEPGGLAFAGGGSSSSGSRAFGYCFPESTVYSYNASLHTIPAINQTADFLQTPFAHIPLAFPQMDADQNPSFSPNHFLVNEKVLMTSSFSENYGQYLYPQNGLSAPFFPDLNFFPEAAACMNITMTPAKDKEIQGSAHGELLGFVALNSKESKLETNAVQSSDLNFSAPLTLDKEKRVQGCIPPQVINLIGQGTIVGENNQELCDQCSNCNSKQCSCTQQGVQQHICSAPQQLESGKDEQGNNPGLSSKGPQKKKTRKRYMPKVFQEGKPIKTPKSVTPKPVTPMKHENQTSKRSYVRKKKTLNSSDTSPHTVIENVGISSAEGTSATPHVVNEIKPVRRKLDFESEGGAANVHLESAMTNTQPRRRGRPRRTPTSSESRSMAKLSQEMEMVENSPVFDLCHSLNQMLQNYTVLPKDPKSPLQSFKKEPFKEPSKHFTGNANSMSNPICGLQPKLKPAEKKVNQNGQADLILTSDKAGTKWSYHHIDSSQTSWTLSRDAHFMQASKKINQASRCDETSSHNSYSQEMHKRMRTEKPELGSHQFAQHCSKGYASADAQKSMISDKSQSPESMLIFNHTKRPTKKRSKIPVRARKITSTPPIIDCNHQLLPTPKKPPETCLEALFSGNSMRMKRKRSTRKAKANLAKITSLNADHENKDEPCIYSSLEQNSVGLTASGRYFQENNLHPVQIIPIEQYLSSNHIHEPSFTYSMSEAIVPYGVNMNDVVWKVQELDIEGRQVHSVAEPQNALVPYGGSMIVPFEKPLDTSKKQRGRAKVELDDETHRVWKLLMGKECNDEAQGSDEDKEKRWEEERRVFHGRVGLFIARMRLVQGERCFSPWKGSVVDSVVGVFLTQNVSDHLSSSAFIALAARFPLQTGSDNADPNAENMNRTEKQDDSKGSDGSNLTSDATNCEEKGFCPNVCDQGPLEIHDADYVKGNEMASINESIGSNTRGNKEDDCKGLGLDIHVREPEIGFLMPHYRIDTLVAVTGSTESEDRQSLEDVVSSQNSVTSPENSLDYLIQTIGLVGSSSGLHSGANLISGSTSIGLGNSALLEENVCMADTTQKQEIEKHGNVRVLSEETCSGYDKEEKKNYGLNNLKSTCRSISYAPDSHLKCSEHNTSGVPSVPSVPSAPSPSDNLNLRSVGMKNINVVREIISNLPSTASENIDNNNVKHCNLLSENTTNSAAEQSALLSKITEAVDSSACTGRYSLQSPTCSRADQGRVYIQQEDFPHENTQYVVDDQARIPYVQEYQKCLNSFDNNARETLEAAKTVESNSKDEACSFHNVPTETAKSTLKAKKAKAETEKAESFDWDSLRRQAYCNGYQRERSSERMDSLDWEAVRCADVNEISGAIRERGMNNVLAGRIKDFLNRLVKEHGSSDLEWLRDIPPDKAKDYLLSIRGLGLKSVECVRLLALHHLAFPVDTNVGRICVRLGWVPLQPLPESLQLHLLEMYPMMATIQKFLWPRLCKLNQETLYELHYQMITFGKVFCTKTKPNCNACPMRGECKHFASAFASARLALPGPEEKSIVSSTTPFASRYDNIHISNPAFLPQPEESNFSQGVPGNNNEPIIEEPASPEPATMENLNTDIDDVFYEDPDIIPTIKLNFEEFKRNLQNYIQDCGIEDQEGDMSKAIVAITEKAASIPMPMLKNVRRLRTEHQVYVIPDSHPILEGLEQRERDDHCPYLLTIWTPGETAISTEPPETCCNSQDTGELCDNKTCFACNCRQEEQAQTIRGTILIPCRTAMRGRFPLNGTYFQKNEVFADHETSISPIHVPRKWIWNLPRRTVHFGTSVTSIFRGLTTEEIQQCFMRGNICVRGFERETRAPRPLCARLHFPASKAPKNKKTPVKEAKK